MKKEFASMLILGLCFACLPRADAELVVIDPSEGRPAGMLSGRILPRQSKDEIVDPGGHLSPSQREAILGTIQKASTAGVGVSVLVLDEAPPVPPMKFGNEISRRWAREGSEVSLLIMSYPRENLIPWVFALSGSQDAEWPQRVSWIAAKAMANSASATNRFDHTVQVAELITGGIVRDLRTGEGSQDVIVPTFLVETMNPAPPEGMQEGVTTGWNLLKPKIPIAWILWAIGVVVGAFVSWVGGRGLVNFFRFRPKSFPRVEHRERFGAPFSGGNNARIYFTGRDRAS